MTWGEPILTDEQVLDHHENEGMRERAVQASRYFPIVVNLSTEATIGRAILQAVEADPLLQEALAVSKQEDLLSKITAIAVNSPELTPVTFKAYAAAGVHASQAPVDVLTYKPAVQMWKCWASGGAAVTLDVFVQM